MFIRFPQFGFGFRHSHKLSKLGWINFKRKIEIFLILSINKNLMIGFNLPKYRIVGHPNAQWEDFLLADIDALNQLE